MKTVLVSLVSDQTVPNVLAIHHFMPDELLFVTSSLMESKGKTDATLKTLTRIGLNYENRYGKVEVQEDSILDCHRKLDSWISGKENSEFIVNITGGTKIMSIGVFEYFKDYGSRMIYIPIGKNEFITPFPKKTSTKPESLNLRLKVQEYLTAYGLKVTNEKKLSEYEQYAAEHLELSKWITMNYESLKNLLAWFSSNLGKHRGSKEIYFSAEFLGPTKLEVELLKRLEFDYSNNNISKKLNRKEIRYLTGGWLEEFCFNEVSAFCGHGIDDVTTGIQLMNEQGRNNEFDVMFTKDNALFFVECKSLDQQNDRKQQQAIYKIGALQKEFGLRVESFLLTTAPDVMVGTDINPVVKERAAQFKTTVILPTQVSEFGEKLKQKLKLGTSKTIV